MAARIVRNCWRNSISCRRCVVTLLRGIAIDARNRIYVANGLNYRVDVYELVNTSGPDSRPPPGAVAER